MTELRRRVLFDLDGTLVDSARGIARSLAWAYEEVGLEPLESQELLPMLGPPLYTALQPSLGSELTSKVVPLYRQHYWTKGIADTALFPGMRELLTHLAARYDLAIATSKPEPYARRITDQLGITDLFVAVVGDGLAGERPTKANVVAEVLARLGTAGLTVMVGDRHHDVLGARANGLPCIGVTWGYSALGELASAGAAMVVHDVEGLRRSLHDPSNYTS